MKLGPISHVCAASCQLAQLKKRGRCQKIMAPLKATSATIGAVTTPGECPASSQAPATELPGAQKRRRAAHRQREERRQEGGAEHEEDREVEHLGDVQDHVRRQVTPSPRPSAGSSRAGRGRRAPPRRRTHASASAELPGAQRPAAVGGRAPRSAISASRQHPERADRPGLGPHVLTLGPSSAWSRSARGPVRHRDAG